MRNLMETVRGLMGAKPAGAAA